MEQLWVTVKAWSSELDNQDKVIILTSLATPLIWWFFVGRRKYSTKGMR